MPSPKTPQENKESVDQETASQIGTARENIESTLDEQAQSLISKLYGNAKNQFNRARNSLKTSKKNIETLDPAQPENELESEIEKFAEQFSGTLVLLTFECLEGSLKDNPEVIEYLKTLVGEIISHPNFDLVKNSSWHKFYLEGEFVKFIEMSEDHAETHQTAKEEISISPSPDFFENMVCKTILPHLEEFESERRQLNTSDSLEQAIKIYLCSDTFPPVNELSVSQVENIHSGITQIIIKLRRLGEVVLAKEVLIKTSNFLSKLIAVLELRKNPPEQPDDKS